MGIDELQSGDDDLRRTGASAVALAALLTAAPAPASEATAMAPHFHNLTPNNMVAAHV